MTSSKFKVWLDSGANHDSAYTTTVSLEEIGFTSEEWAAATESEQEEAMKEIAFQWSDWGYVEIESDA